MSLASAPPSLDTLAVAFETATRRMPLSPASVRAYVWGVREYAAWLGVQTKHAYDEVVSDSVVATHAARDFRRYLLTERKLAPKTVDSAVTAIGAMYGWLGMARPDVKSAAPSRPAEPKSLEEDQVRDVLRAAERRGLRDHALVMTLYAAGLRISECGALDVDDVPLSERRCVVKVRAGKGDKPRDVPVEFQEAITLLNRWSRARRDQGMPADSGPLFTTTTGARLSVRSIHYVVAQVGKKAGVELTPHTLRHTYGRTMIDRGHDVFTVADLMGHSSVNTTMVYARSRASHRAAAAASVAIDY